MTGPRPGSHKVKAIDYRAGTVSCRCGWSRVDTPKLEPDALAEAFAEHHRRPATVTS